MTGFTVAQTKGGAVNRLTEILGTINGSFNSYVLVIALVGVGLVLTIALRGMQVRLFGQMLGHVIHSRAGAEGGISSFQAFAIGMATRIGIGNITGVAIALALGGPGAVFWMWLVASLGMATAFSEATLAQVFKVRWPDGTFRGGPSYYLSRGAGSTAWGKLFAIALVFAMVIAMPMVQANAIAVNMADHGVPQWVTGVIIAALAAAVLFAGVRGVARTAEILTPIMALIYVIIALTVVIANIEVVPGMLADIVRGAFALDTALYGTGGGIVAAILNGAQRGLFSNEAGMGTNPNAAATATVKHPVHQGFIQSFGVFFDTAFICTATALIILVSDLYVPGVTDPDAAGNLTSEAVQAQWGSWMALPMSIMIFVFGFSSILGAFAYGVAGADFLQKTARNHYVLASLVLVFSVIGAAQQILTVWIIMDTAMILITLVNLVGLIVLLPWTRALLADFEAQRAAGIAEPVFDPAKVKLPRPLHESPWADHRLTN